MKIQLFCSLLFINFSSFANDTATLNFSARVKNEIERTFLEGQQRFEYDGKRNLVRTWRDKNISAQDMEAYLKAYDIAHDLERKIRLSNELKAQKYMYTDFSEHVAPVIPLKP